MEPPLDRSIFVPTRSAGQPKAHDFQFDLRRLTSKATVDNIIPEIETLFFSTAALTTRHHPETNFYLCLLHKLPNSQNASHEPLDVWAGIGWRACAARSAA